MNWEVTGIPAAILFAALVAVFGMGLYHLTVCLTA